MFPFKQMLAKTEKVAILDNARQLLNALLDDLPARMRFAASPIFCGGSVVKTPLSCIKI